MHARTHAHTHCGTSYYWTGTNCYIYISSDARCTFRHDFWSDAYYLPITVQDSTCSNGRWSSVYGCAFTPEYTGIISSAKLSL